MKRYGIEATREALKNGAFIRAWDFYTLNAGYKITTEGGEMLGFITCDLFSKLLKNGEIVKTAPRPLLLILTNSKTRTTRTTEATRAKKCPYL